MAKTINREERQKTINNLARQMKAEQDPGKKCRLRNKLTEMVLEDIGFIGYIKGFTSETTLEEHKSFEYYDNMVFAAAFSYAEKDFGRRDNLTGDEIPFMRLFNYAWKLKGPDIIAHKNEETGGANRSAKRTYMKIFLDNCCKEKGIRFDGRFNLLNLEAVLKWLRDNGFGSDKERRAEYIIENSVVISDELVRETDEEGVFYVSDKAYVEQYYCSERVLQAICDRAERAIKYVEPRKVKQMRYWLTLEYTGGEAEDHGIYGMYLREILDSDLAEFIRKKNYPDDYAGVLAEYLGFKRDTTRRMIREMKKIEEKLK